MKPDCFKAFYIDKLLSKKEYILITNYFDSDICAVLREPEGGGLTVFIHYTDLQSHLNGKRPYGIKKVIRKLAKWCKENNAYQLCYLYYDKYCY